MRATLELYNEEPVVEAVPVYTCEGEEPVDFRVAVTIRDHADAVEIEGDALVVLRALEEAAAKIRARAAELVTEGIIDPAWESETVEELMEHGPKQDGNGVN